MSQLFTLPRQVRIDSAGTPYANAKAYFYRVNTTTAQAVYTDPTLGQAHSQPVQAGADGQFPPIWLDSEADYGYRVIIQSSGGVQLDDYPITAGDLDQSEIAAALWPQTVAEQAAGVTPADYAFPPADLRRYGADVTGVQTSDTALVSAAAANYQVIFPPGILKFAAKFTPPHQLTFIFPGVWALTINVTVNDFWVETTTSGKSVSCYGGAQIVGNTANTLSGGFNLFDNGDRPLQDLLMHDFGKEAVKFVQCVNPILKDSRIYNAGATSATDAAVTLDGGSTQIVSAKLDNVYLTSTNIGLKLVDAVGTQLNKLVVESCAVGLHATTSTGDINGGWWEANTVDGDFTDSQITRNDVRATNTPDGIWNYTWTGATGTTDRGTQRGERMAGGGYSTAFQIPSNSGVWDDVQVISTSFPSYRVIPNPGGAAFAVVQTTKKGYYRIDYRGTFQNASAAVRNVALRLVNAATEIPGSYVNAQVPIAGASLVSGVVFVSLDAEDEIKLQMSSGHVDCTLNIVTTGLAAPTATVYAALTLQYLGVEA